MAAIIAHRLSSGQPGSASFASVVIKNHTSQEIQAAAVGVFQDDGYTAALTGPGELRFEKEGTRGNDLAYNGLVGTHYGATHAYSRRGGDRRTERRLPPPAVLRPTWCATPGIRSPRTKPG